MVSLTRQQEVYMMKPRLALLQAGAFGLNLIKTGEFDAARAAVADPAAIAAQKRRKAKKREKQNAKIEEENKKGLFGKKSNSSQPERMTMTRTRGKEVIRFSAGRRRSRDRRLDQARR